MNYYPFHLGDYAAHTAHLDPLEDLAYRRMLDAYYLREAPLPADPAEVARLIRLRQNLAEVEAVLREFFLLTEDGWSHARCDQEIDRMQDKQAKARASAAASVNARRAKAQPQTNDQEADAERTFNERSADVELPTPTPTPNTSSSSPAKLPTCPAQALVDLYHEVLPELPRVRLMTEDRKKSLRKLWQWVLTSKKSDGMRRADTADDALDWVRGYFARARDNDFLMGRVARAGEHANWRCDLDFLLTERGMKHVIEKTPEAA